jgi:hypothetical protein
LHRHRLRTGLVLASALLCTGVARAQEAPPRVGVVTALAVNASRAEADALADAMGAALADELIVDVIAGTQAARRLPPQGLPDDCVAQPDCIADVATRLAADQLLLLVVVRVGDELQVDTTWVEVSTGRSASRPAIMLGSGDEPARVFAARATQLLPGVRERPDGPPPPGASTTVHFNAAPEVTVIEVPRHMTTGTWIAGGVAGAALIGGTVFGLSAWSKRGEAEDACQPTNGCAPGHPDYALLDQVEDTALVADLLFGVAIGAGITAAVLYLTSDGERTVTTPAVGVGATGDTVGITVGGRF